MGLKSQLKKTLPVSFWNQLRLLKLRYRSGTFKRYNVNRTYCGFPFELEIADETGKLWYDLGQQDVYDVEWLTKGRQMEGATVFDIGAHQGVIAMIFAKLVGTQGKVVAVEAFPSHAEIAKRNCELNSISNVLVLNAGGAATKGEVEFSGMDGAVTSSRSSVGVTRVPALTIDDLDSEYGTADFILLDVEGYEIEVLKGASRTLTVGAHWMVEVHVNVGLEKFGGSVEQVVSFFPPDAYDLFFIEEEGLLPFEILSPLAANRFYLAAFSKASSR